MRVSDGYSSMRAVLDLPQDEPLTEQNFDESSSDSGSSILKLNKTKKKTPQLPVLTQE